MAFSRVRLFKTILQNPRARNLSSIKNHFNTNGNKQQWNFGRSSSNALAYTLLASPFILYGIQTVFADDEKRQVQIESKEEEPQTKSSGDERLVYKYVIIGGGTTAFSALKEILEKEPSAHVLLVSNEGDLPYSRPPLTKELWKSEDPDVAKNLVFKNFEGKEQHVLYEQEQFYRDQQYSTVILGRDVVDIDPVKRAILLDNKMVISYEKCLIATGGTPRLVPNIAEEAKDAVTTFRTLADFKKLDKIARTSKHIVVIGGGFLGSELACGLAVRGKQVGSVQVTQVFPESGLMGLAFPRYLSDYTTNRVRSELGFNILPEHTVKSVVKNQNGQLVVTLDNGQAFEADHVVVAAGIKPNTTLATLGDLEIDPKNGGILVNSELQARSNLWVAGDVASYYDMYLGRRRVEHYDHAVNSGKIAARNMLGGGEVYNYLPFFWSDVSTMGYEAVGILDSKLNTVGIWEKPEGKEVDEKNPDYRKGIVYYLNAENKVVGVMLWNLFGKVDEARAIIKRSKAVNDPEELKNFISLEDAH